MKLTSSFLATATLAISLTFTTVAHAKDAVKIKGKIADTAELVTPLMPGEMVPDVTVWSENGKPLSLPKIVQSKPTIVVFYRGGWCPYCNTQLRELQSIEAQLSDMGYQVLALSPELPDKIKSMKQAESYSYHLLSDFQIDAAKAFGIAFRMKEKTAKYLEDKLDAKLQKHEGEQAFNLPVPAVFVFDTEGRIQFSYANPNYSVRLHPKLLLTAAEVALLDENVRHKRK